MMDHRSAKDEGVEVDLESGFVVVTKDNSQKQGTTTLFAKISCGIVKDSTKGEGKHKNAPCNESNLSGVSVDVAKVMTNKVLERKDCAGKTPLKEKREKSSSNKKAPKPPRPPRAPSLDAADLKLIREISELAMLKQARIERMKALKKMKSAKSSPSSGSTMFAMIFTVVFCIVILLQGTSAGKSSAASFQGSPVPAGKPDAGLIAVQYQHLNPSSSDPNAPALASRNFDQPVTSSDLPVKLRRLGR